jgi:threonine aldolase
MVFKNQRIVDLRSDAKTLPTDDMLDAIRYAELGDNRSREDPTVNKLEALAASKLGKEAALLVCSGIQANLVSLMTNTQRGDEVILESECHMYHYEYGNMSAIGGVIPHLIKGTMGVLDPEDVEDAINPTNHYPPTTLICIENTHNRAGGTIITPNQIKAVHKIAVSHDIPLYMDGSRIFNAAVALRKDVTVFTKHVDSLMFCLSKGLSAPIGSILVGTREFIERARIIQTMLGGGMRQAGIIAAPGIIALEKMVTRLREDHDNAKMLAEGLAKIKRLSINLETVQTNIVIFDIRNVGYSVNTFISKLNALGVKSSHFGGTRIRMVTHRAIEPADITYTLEAVKKIVKT